METISSLGYGEARLVVDAAIEAAVDQGLNVSVAVISRVGGLRAFASMDGAAMMTLRIAQDKAYTVTMVAGAPTSTVADTVTRDPTLMRLFAGDPRILLAGGGEPIVVDGEYVGAVGVSGAPSAELDSEIALAGIAALGTRASSG